MASSFFLVSVADLLQVLRLSDVVTPGREVDLLVAVLALQLAGAAINLIAAREGCDVQDELARKHKCGFSFPFIVTNGTMFGMVMIQLFLYINMGLFSPMNPAVPITLDSRSGQVTQGHKKA